ncbi:holin family protein [Phaeobacter gallaeciensis]|uniref:holin family protein n=1 Tax=Phaeobacter gallaeciensis TaxID=60890 RepID=UPI00237F9AC0|nr:holin family protein [Phaeobacter gallaeciensis]MDE4189957.1 holin family protein [Phaeobacter gallaeciensis]MDE4199110.1 holin family protein [Phaeobacter gallaeciensis]MDE4203258.1 holin family protein [Phaeobacter gallaeciensis]MDE4207400.1 holin family protein [Phaeobacter gallaeciensis]MDE4215376.1 holin family protein [Phaeobacter gallaeciensis]
MITGLFRLLFGSNRNVLRNTVEVFRENAEAGAERASRAQGAALQQFAAEFRAERRSGFDRVMDGINRLPRPLLALGTVGLMVSAMANPAWFAARMQGLAAVPEPLWWLLGAIVSFYFGARHQIKSQEFQRNLAKVAARMPKGVDGFASLRGGDAPSVQEAPSMQQEGHLAASAVAENPALAAWKQSELRLLQADPAE